MILITSAAYVGDDLQSEFGRIPPSYLPLANVALLQHQVGALRSIYGDEQIVLSLPDSFSLNLRRRKEIVDLGVHIIRVPEGLQLGESVLYAITSSGSFGGVTRILHGDTLITDFPSESDVILIAETQDDYDWEIESTSATHESIWCGFFSFSDTPLLMKCLVRETSFTGGVRLYDEELGLGKSISRTWEDLGHVNTYFRSRERRTTERSFNDIGVSSGVLTKTGVPHEKIVAEAQWFMQLPMNLKPFTPAFYGSGLVDGLPCYHLEFLQSMPLNELFIHAQSSSNKWEQVFDAYDDWFREALSHSEFSDVSQRELKFDLVATKSRSRIREYAESHSLDLTAPQYYDGKELPSIEDIIEDLIRIALDGTIVPGYVHGDLCFSNSMYDSRSMRLKFIDPRGMSFSSNDLSIGDLTYDLAKLSHSVLGMYDYIIAGAYSLTYDVGYGGRIEFPTDGRVDAVQDHYRKRVFGGSLHVRNSLAQMTLLFFSMLPLHSDRPDSRAAAKSFARGWRLNM
ncbi:hypothetical protein ACX80D_16925 [Arthrobacter sp. Sr24]